MHQLTKGGDGDVVSAEGVVVKRIVVVTGASRGIGLEVSRQLASRGDTVVLGARNVDAVADTVADLLSAGVDLQPRRLDVTDQTSIDVLVTELTSTYGRLDVLINNAAIHFDTWQAAAAADLQVIAEALDTNLFGAYRMVAGFLPLLRKSEHGRIVNVSSEQGSLASMAGGCPAYKTTKVGLNALTVMLSKELAGDRILVNSVCPGWIATDMGGPNGRPISYGAANVIWGADLPDDGPTGGFFRDGKGLRW